MKQKIHDQIRKSLIEERDTHYIFSDDFLKEIGGITEKEDEAAQKIMSIIGSDKNHEEEIMFVLQPYHLFNFLFSNC